MNHPKQKKNKKTPNQNFKQNVAAKKEKKKKYLPAGEKICRRQSWTGTRSAGRQRTPDAERERRREGRTPDAGRERRREENRRRERERAGEDLPEGEDDGRPNLAEREAPERERAGEDLPEGEDDGQPSLEEWEAPERGNTPERERESWRGSGCRRGKTRTTDDGRRAMGNLYGQKFEREIGTGQWQWCGEI
jgi:hypothetical protein